ncbi:MAG: hypothetical protein ACJ77Z_01890, partial [Thermoleophilaceae bacterium]
AIRDAIAERGDSAASASFGVVTLVVLGFVLIERELLAVVRGSRARLGALFAVAASLSVAVGLTIGTRIGDLIP